MSTNSQTIDAEREKLILDNLDLVEILTRKYQKKFRNFIPRDELYSTLSCAMVQSACNFDFSAGKNFRKFVSGRLHGSVVDYIRSIKNWGSAHAKKNLCKTVYMSENYDTCLKEKDESLFETKAFFDQIRLMMTEFEYKIVHEIVFNDLSLPKVAEKLGESFKCINTSYKLAKEKIRFFFSQLEYDEKTQWCPIFWKYDVKEETKVKDRWQQSFRNKVLLDIHENKNG